MLSTRLFMARRCPLYNGLSTSLVWVKKLLKGWSLDEWVSIVGFDLVFLDSLKRNKSVNKNKNNAH